MKLSKKKFRVSFNDPEEVFTTELKWSILGPNTIQIEKDGIDFRNSLGDEWSSVEKPGQKYFDQYIEFEIAMKGGQK